MFVKVSAQKGILNGVELGFYPTGLIITGVGVGKSFTCKQAGGGRFFLL